MTSEKILLLIDRFSVVYKKRGSEKISRSSGILAPHVNCLSHLLSWPTRDLWKTFMQIPK